MSLIGHNIFYSYAAGHFALAGVNVEVERGEVLFLLGANGSGKTTLLECLCGVRVPQRGKVSLDGKSLSSLSARERAKNIAYVPQFPETTFAYTVEEMILMGRAPHIGPFGQPGPRDREKVEEVLALVGLEPLRARSVNALSGGERRLVLIARGLAQEAPYLLLDEPDAHLDPANQHRVLSVVCRLAKNGLGVVATTHNPNSPLLYAQRVLLLRSGRTLATGDPRHVLSAEILTEAYGIAFQVIGNSSGPKAILPLVETH